VPNAEKIKSVEELNQVLVKAKSAVLANYQGIDAVELAALRAHMRKSSVEFRVVKNTLAREAAKNTEFEVMSESLKGPISLALSFEDPVAPAKAMADFVKTGPKKAPEVIGGVVEGKAILPQQVKDLANLPSREVLLSQMLSVMQGPTTNFVGVFSSLLRKLVGTLDAVREKKNSG